MSGLEYSGRLSGDRLGFVQSWVELLALPVALLVSLLLRGALIGRLLLVPVQLQFHELGHVALAWLSGRAALPLPFGVTFWREKQSVVAACGVAFMLSLLLQRALRERRLIGAAVALFFVLLFLLLAVVLPAEHSRMLVLAGGVGGELVLTSLVIVAFYLPLPDRLRWEFFRFVLLLPAVACWLAAVELWVRVWRGTRSFPIGTVLGTPGDGSDDLARLISEFQLDELALSGLFGRLSLFTVACVALTYGVRALLAVRALRPLHRFSARGGPLV